MAGAKGVARLDAASLGKSGDKNIKRPSTAKRGRVLGHQQGLYTDRPLLSLIDARSFIYAPLYRWQLQRHCQDALAHLNKALAQSDIVLLEAGNESNICDIFVPMVHSELLRLFLLGQYPECGEKHPWQPYTKAEHEADIERRKQAKKERIKQQKLLLKQQTLLLE